MRRFQTFTTAAWIAVVWSSLSSEVTGAPKAKKERPKPFVCPEQTGTFANPKNCESYWICSNGNPIAATCNFGLIYDHTLKNCGWADIKICTVMNGEVIRDWAPPPPPTFAPIPALDANGDPVKDGQERPHLSQYELLIAKWKYEQKLKNATTKSLKAEKNTSSIVQSTFGLTREKDYPGPQGDSYNLNETVTPAPRRLYTVAPVGGAPIACGKRCRLPDCYCEAHKIPGGLEPEDTPQIVMVTFDDAVNWGNIAMLDKLFSLNRTNPNGCPITGTFFLSNGWTDYKLVEVMAKRGHEFASHSINHVDLTNANAKQWRNEIIGQKQIVMDYAKLNSSEVIGMRAPFLGLNGDTTFKLLWDHGFLYDSSIPSKDLNPPLWPYTLDAPLPHSCFLSSCPTGHFPGLWEVPMTYFMGLNDIGCSMYDACTLPPDTDDLADMFYANFKKHYETNRSPFLLSSHSPWYLGNTDREDAMVQFMERVLKLGDVWFVSVRQAIQWMQNPTPISKLQDFKPWQCEKPK